jgi:hypothetical protein
MASAEKQPWFFEVSSSKSRPIFGGHLTFRSLATFSFQPLGGLDGNPLRPGCFGPFSFPAGQKLPRGLIFGYGEAFQKAGPKAEAAESLGPGLKSPQAEKP